MSPSEFAVNQFLDHFRTQADDIGKVISPFHRKILYSTAFDPLARAAFGKKGSHRERFVKLVREIAKWKDADRMSLPQLQLRLREARRYRNRLYRHTKRITGQWEPGGKIPISASPLEGDLLAYADPMEKNHISESMYVQLFYTYRNNLVHEFREPGYGTDWSGKALQPFYSCFINGPWELVFPVAFIKDLFDQTLLGMETHLASNKIDPYLQFEFGSLWRAK